MDTNTRNILNIIKSGITGKKASVSPDYDVNNSLELVFKHRIVNVFYNGLVNSGIDVDDYIKNLFLKSLFFELSTDENQQNIKKEIIDIFNENAIDHMLLKGSMLKKLYPKPEMRRMGDIDILIRQKQYKSIRKILNSSGYAEEGESGHEYKWTKNGVLIELHKRLVGKAHDDLYAYYGDDFKNAISCGNYSYKMSDEDFLIFLIVHFVKHYRKTGIGIMHMCDLYIYLNSKKIDNRYMQNELTKLSLWEFYNNLIYTLEVWFGDAEPTPKSDHITDVIMASGAYGIHSTYVVFQTLKSRKKHKNPLVNKLITLIYALFPPYSTMKNRYTILRKLPFLLPVYWIIRGVDVVFVKKRVLRGFSENILGADEKTLDDYRRQLEYVGLKF